MNMWCKLLTPTIAAVGQLGALDVQCGTEPRLARALTCCILFSSIVVCLIDLFGRNIVQLAVLAAFACSVRRQSIPTLGCSTSCMVSHVVGPVVSWSCNSPSWNSSSSHKCSNAEWIINTGMFPPWTSPTRSIIKLCTVHCIRFME